MTRRSDLIYHHALVDLFMLLLLIFSGKELILAQQPDDVDIVIPGQNEQQKPDDAPGDALKRLDLFLSADGALLVAGEQTVMADLVKKARAEQIVKVHLKVDKSTPYAKVLEVIRQLDNERLTVELG